MRKKSVRTWVDIPVSLYRKLKAQAAAQGCSVREFVLATIKVSLLKEKRPGGKRVRFPLIALSGPKIHISNEKIYNHVEFP
jgi:hypothetical protein